MRRMRALLSRLLDPFRRRARERDLDAELAAHLDLHVADNVRAGMTPDEARRAALLRLGGVQAVKEQYRDRRGLPLLDTLAQDVRHGVRLIRRTPAFSFVVIASLALGIGANTAMFSILNALLLRTLPVQDPQRLAILAPDTGWWTNPIWEQVRQHQDLVDGATAWGHERFASPRGGRLEPVEGLYVSGEFFDVLGVRPHLGRLLTAADDRRGGAPGGPVAVISARFWSAHFGGAPDVVGRPLVLNRIAFTIVGVTPPGFLGPEVGGAFDVAVPIGTEPLFSGKDSWLDRRGSWWLTIMLRLKPGQSVDAATAALRTVQPRIREATLPDDPRPDVVRQYLTTPFTLKSGATGTSPLRGRYERPLTILLGVVGLVLLIAAANIANLLLARARARRYELTLRLALGAPRLRLCRQLLIESLLLSVAGAAAGLALAAASSRLLVSALSTQASQVSLDLAIDWRVLAFTAAVAIGTALVFGTAPALQAARLDPNDALKMHGRTIAGETRVGPGGLLVVAQVALSLVLLVGAGLFIRTFDRLTGQPLGFEGERVLIANVDLVADDVEPEARAAFYERLRETVEALPGVARASASMVTPFNTFTWSDVIDASAAPGRSQADRVFRINVVSPGFFETWGMRLLAGRDFTARDAAGAPSVVIVNQAFARKFLPGDQPIGRVVTMASLPGRPSTKTEVVGYVADAVYRDLREPIQPTMFVSLPQREHLPHVVKIAVRPAAGASDTLAAAVSSALRTAGADASVTVVPMRTQMRDSLVQERLLAALSGAFGALALLLAGIGLYGVTSYAVTRRRTEMALRMAMGAAPSRVVGLVLTRVVWLVAAGVVAGTAVTLWASRFVTTLLYGLEPRDPATLAGAAVLLVVIGLLAGALPALRAASVDPARVLREG